MLRRLKDSDAAPNDRDLAQAGAGSAGQAAQVRDERGVAGSWTLRDGADDGLAVGHRGHAAGIDERADLDNRQPGV